MFCVEDYFLLLFLGTAFFSAFFIFLVLFDLLAATSFVVDGSSSVTCFLAFFATIVELLALTLFLFETAVLLGLGADLFLGG